jgi:hypothetical protein
MRARTGDGLSQFITSGNRLRGQVLLDEATAIIADRLGRRGTPESEMMWALDGVPMSIILEAADRLGVTVRGGVWRVRRPGLSLSRPPAEP